MRERLKPYILEDMKRAREEGIPFMRPLFFDFPKDRITYEIEDKHLFGPDLLIAPVVKEGARKRKVYLPQVPAGPILMKR